MKHLKKFESYSSNRVDELLDKINDQGIDSLTDEEKEILKSNGILPGGEKKSTYEEDEANVDDIDDDEPLFHKSDLDAMVERDDITEEEVGKDWLERREKARELYDFKYFKTNFPGDIYLQLDEILDYIDDEKNAPVFKKKVIKYFLNNINHINQKIKRKEFTNIANMLSNALEDYE